MDCRRSARCAAVAALSLVAAGCGGTSSSRTAGDTSSTTVEYGTSGANAGALAFAHCMRSHGIPGWPDPERDGGFDKSKLRQLGVSPSQVRAIEERSCHYSFQNGGPTQTITASDRIDYLKAAACMRRHGFPDFPDPTFPNDSVEVDIPSSVDQSSPRFKSAATTCVKLIPTGLPYTRPRGS